MKTQLFLLAICFAFATTEAASESSKHMFSDKPSTPLQEDGIIVKAETSVSELSHEQTLKQIYHYTNQPSGCATGIICSKERNIEEVLMLKPQITFIAHKTAIDQTTNTNSNECCLAVK